MVFSTCRAPLRCAGDAIAICMPMTAATVSIYLGIVWAGCAVVGIADSFAKEQVESRLKVASASAMFTQDVILRGGKVLPLYQRLAGLPLRHGMVVLPADDGAGLQVRAPCPPANSMAVTESVEQ